MLARPIFLGRCYRVRVLDRSERRAGRRLHDPGDLLRGARDIAPRLAHLGLFSDDRVVRVRSKLTELRGAVALVTGGNGGLGRRTAMHHFGQKGPRSMMPPASMSSPHKMCYRWWGPRGEFVAFRSG